MGTKIKSIPEAAGVKCPKSTGEMDRKETCTKCDHYRKCLHQLGLALELPGDD